MRLAVVVAEAAVVVARPAAVARQRAAAEERPLHLCGVAAERPRDLLVREQRELELLEGDALAARLAVAVNLGVQRVSRDLVAGEAPGEGVRLGGWRLLLRRGVVVERRRVRERAVGLGTRRLCRLVQADDGAVFVHRLRRHVQVVGARREAHELGSAARREVDRRDGTVGRRRRRRVGRGGSGAARPTRRPSSLSRSGAASPSRTASSRAAACSTSRRARAVAAVGWLQLLHQLLHQLILHQLIMVRGEEGDGQRAAVRVQRARGEVVVLKVGVGEVGGEQACEVRDRLEVLLLEQNWLVRDERVAVVAAELHRPARRAVLAVREAHEVADPAVEARARGEALDADEAFGLHRAHLRRGARARV